MLIPGVLSELQVGRMLRAVARCRHRLEMSRCEILTSVRRLLLGVGILVACSVVAACGGSVRPSPAPSSPTATPTPNPLVLAPATVPSAVGICSQQLTFGADGGAYPQECGNGAINVLAWKYYDQPGYSKILALGPDATPNEAQAALCAAPQDPLPWVLNAYQLAYTYYRWTFAGMDPNTMVTDGC